MAIEGREKEKGRGDNLREEEKMRDEERTKEQAIRERKEISQHIEHWESWE